MPLHQRLRILVGLDELPSLDPIVNQPTGCDSEVGIQGQRSFQRGVRTLSHNLAAVRIGRIVMLSNAERGPRGRIAGV